MLGAVLTIGLFAQSARPLFEEAVAALSRQDYVSAEKAFRAVLRLEPKNIGALGNLGVVLTRMRRYQDAVDTYQKALELAPSEPNLLLNLGLAYSKQDRCDLALAPFTAAAAARPDHGQSRELLAACQLRTGKANEVVATLDQAQATPGVLYLQAAAFTKLKQRGKAEAVFQQLLGTLSAAQANGLIGRAYYQAGHFEEAITALEQTEAWLDLGKAYISARRNEEAQAALAKALAKDPGDVEAHYYLGALLVQLQKYDEAAPHLKKAAETDPDLWGSFYYLGRAALESKQNTQAIVQLEKSARLNPNESAIYFLLARAYSEAGRKVEAGKALARVKELKAEGLQKEIDIISGPR